MITITGRDFKWKPGLTVGELLTDLKKRGKYDGKIGTPGLVMVVAGNIVPTDQYDTTTINENDTIHILSFMAGG